MRAQVGILLGPMLALATCVVGAPARAAGVELEAPADCASQASLTAAVEALVGAPMASLPALSFRARIAAFGQGYRLELDSFAPGRSRGRRVIDGADCREVADAAAVAIALALSAALQAPEPEPQPEPITAPDSELASTPVPKTASAPGPVAPPETPPAAATPVVATAALGVGLDAGTLPAVSPGAELSLGVGYGHWSARGQGLWTAGQRATPSDGAVGAGAGLFSLTAVGLLGCWTTGGAAPFFQACAGAELLAVHAAGRQLSVRHSHTDIAAGLSAELGLGLPIAGPLSLWLRPGLSVPLSRPRFLLPDQRQLHQVSPVAARASLLVQWSM